MLQSLTHERDFHGADAQQLPALGEFDAVVSGLVLNFLPDPADSLRQMAQTTSPGGIVSAYVWDYADSDATPALLLGCGL